MLNRLVHGKFTNHQYETLVDPETFKYETHSENSIFFEVDGPYRAMILPTSKEEDKNLKKRYAVFNDDGTLAELKGFEVKRRGELKLIKIFQQQIFKFFLDGTTLAETYAAVAKVANQWLDVLHSRGKTLTDDELIDLICENRSMSKPLSEYGSQKSTSITTARRLADFLGDQMVKDKGLNCKYIISAKPKNSPVTERAIPVAIFSAEESTKRIYLHKWLKEIPSDMDPKALIDWDYYLERLGSVIQKLITIPAALQKVENPVPRVLHPEWLQRRINIKEDRLKQKKVTDIFKPTSANRLNKAGQLGDLEDSCLELLKPKTISQVLSQSSQKSLKRKGPEPDVAVSINPYAALPRKMPDPSDDYIGFLNYQKQKWIIQKQQRIRRRHLFGEANFNTQNKIGAAFRNQAEMQFSGTWQLLHLCETSSPGIVLAFVLIDSKIHHVKINVPRQIYLNLKRNELPDIEIDGCRAQKITDSLPNGHPSVHLFRLTMSEDVYVSNTLKFSLLFNHPSVEGVYEKQVPLNVRAILQLGNLCTIDETKPGILGKGLESGFDLSGLKRSTNKSQYLSSSPMAFLYLYHVAAGNRQIFTLISTIKYQAYIVIVLNKNESTQEMPNIGKIYRDSLAQVQEQLVQKSFSYQDQLQFKISQVTTRRKALLEVGGLMKKMKNDESKPLLLVVQSPQHRMLVHDLPIINEFPVLSLRYEISDNNLPPLGWQKLLFKRLINHYLSLDSWILHLTELARYGDVPLCNLEKDDPRYLIDIAYARRLQKNNVLLWWSAGPRPDHAGYEKDDVYGPLETVKMPSVNNPGTYPSVCIELDVRNLAINTLLTSSLINELEGSDSVSYNPAAHSEELSVDGSNIQYSYNAFLSAGVSVLREMVKAWWTEACKGSTMADIMVQHLVRWVENPDSFLYDRSLHYYVQMMSRKAFQQLMADFRRVGSHVVFANSHRLLLQTTKSEVGNAYAYSQYILKSIKAKPLFHFLDLEIKEYWDFLVWYDEFNYGGKACTEVVEAQNQTLDCVMHWQLSKFLPKILQPIFHDWVVEFVDIMHKLKLSQSSINSTSRSTQLPTRLSLVESEDKIILGKGFSKPLKRQIAGLLQRQKDETLHPELASDYSFPVLAGSHLNLSNPALQLVKSIMQVLSLDKNITMEVRLLRKELLTLFNIREFSSEAQFENPSTSLTLTCVICDNCTMSRDFDFCRDDDLIQETGVEGQSHAWRCLTCNGEYDRLKIEEMLIAMVQGMSSEWYGQDLKCIKCGSLCVNDFMEHCTCSGPWGESIGREEVVSKLRVMSKVAKVYDLRMLSTVVRDILAGL